MAKRRVPAMASEGYTAEEPPPAAPEKAVPKSLGDLFKSKAKKKPKANNLNADRPKEPEKPKGPSKVALAAAQDEGWERALKRDEELLAACGLRMNEMEADGACLFRAFSDQMDGDGGSGHAAYREKCIDFLQAHRSDFEPFLEDDFDEYCARMRKATSWGGHVEVQALSRALGINALIYQPAEAGRADRLSSSAVEMATSEVDDTRCVQLSYHPTHHAGQHYNSVRCSTDDSTGPPPSASLTELRRRIEEALKPPEPIATDTSAAKTSAKAGGKKIFF